MDAIVLCVRFVRRPSQDPSESQSRRDSRSRSCPCCVWLRAPWSVGTFSTQTRYVLIDRSACLVEPCVAHPCLCRPHQARLASRPVAARECPSRGLVEGLLAPPSCSLRAALSLPSLHRDCFSHLPRLRRFHCTLFSTAAPDVAFNSSAKPSRRSRVRAPCQWCRKPWRLE